VSVPTLSPSTSAPAASPAVSSTTSAPVAPSSTAVPEVAVLMTAYNAERYIAAAVQSVLDQTFAEFELVVVDDGSTDGTLRLLQDFARRDPRVRIISRPNTGLTGALNDGLATIRSPLVARMDADDLCLPNRLELQVRYMREHPECVLLGCQTELIDPHGLHIGYAHWATDHETIDAELLRGIGGTVPHPGAIMRRDAVVAVGAYRDQYNNSEDLDLWLRLAERGRVANLPDVLLRYRRHYDSVCHNKFENQRRIKRSIVSEAYQRRGLTMPADWKLEVWQPKDRLEQILQWGWIALNRGHRSGARRHAWDALRYAPLSKESWRLMYCALRGR
jgi:glycosyltransferase involved in cell wall biosynthesis